MDRLTEIETPALRPAGTIFNSRLEHQAILAYWLPNAELALIERAGHNAPMERPEEVMADHAAVHNLTIGRKG